LKTGVLKTVVFLSVPMAVLALILVAVWVDQQRAEPGTCVIDSSGRSESYLVLCKDGTCVVDKQ
jgi:hypothetical protein